MQGGKAQNLACACASEVYGSVFVCVSVCLCRLLAYSCSRINEDFIELEAYRNSYLHFNEVQVRVSIGMKCK